MNAALEAISTLPSALQAAVLAGEPAADLWPHVMDAQRQADASGRALYLGPGLWWMRPDATANIRRWVGVPGATRVCIDTGNFADAHPEDDPVLRLVDRGGLAGITITEDGLHGRATLLQMGGRSLAGAREFTGWLKLDNVVFDGFARQLDLENTFFFSAEQCEFMHAAQAVRCMPRDEGSGSDTGYFTTHQWRQCSWRDNGQHVRYAPQRKGTCLLLVQCEAGAASSAGQARVHLDNITAVQAFSFYLEHSPEVPGVDWGTCSQATWEGGRASGTGGVRLGTNCQLSMRNVQLVTPTDTITGGNWSNALALEGVEAPAAGNCAWSDFGRFSARDSSYNGTTWADFAGARAAGFSVETFGDDIAFNLRFGNTQRVRITDARPVRLSRPVNAAPGTWLKLQFENRTAHAHGALQWSPAYRLAPGFEVAPGTVSTIAFEYDGEIWTQQGAAAHGVPL